MAVLSLSAFLRLLPSTGITELERAVAVLWWRLRFGDGPHEGASAGQIADDLATAGHARPHVSRLRTNLGKDRRTNQPKKGVFRLSTVEAGRLDQEYLQLLDEPLESAGTEFLPGSLFSASRGYMQKTVVQANLSFEHRLFDCCAVMTRRLLETLLIDLYELHGKQDELKGQDGHYLMFSGLLGVVESANAFHLGRATLDTLKKFKLLVELSADH